MQVLFEFTSNFELLNGILIVIGRVNRLAWLLLLLLLQLNILLDLDESDSSYRLLGVDCLQMMKQSMFISGVFLSLPKKLILSEVKFVFIFSTKLNYN